MPATSTELDETADGVRKLGRKCKTVHADIRDIASLRAIRSKFLFGLEMGHSRTDEIGIDGAGQAQNTVNALIPGHVDTALTRYPARYHASVAMTEMNPPSDPTPQQVWDARLPMVPLKIGWMKPADLGPAAVFLASDGAAMA